jgi:hypothetical protein
MKHHEPVCIVNQEILQRMFRFVNFDVLLMCVGNERC